MIDDLFNNQEDENTIFRDVVLLALITFAAMLIIVIPFLADPTETDDSEVTSPGNLIAEIMWSPDLNDDIDLWLIGPGEPGPIGYSNKSGLIWNLLRDDLGGASDLTGMNYENAYSRGLAEGWYRFNVHWYNSHSKVTEIQVKMVISIKKTPEDSVRQLATRTVTLTKGAREVTVFYIYLDEEFNLDSDNVSFDFGCLKCDGGNVDNFED